VIRRAPLVLLVLVALLAGCGGDDDEPAASAQDAALSDALREGGVALVMRHAKTETTTDRVEEIGDCTTQRNLSAEGREQARQVGRDIEALGVPVDEVLTSPLCRTEDTANLAFGESTPRMALLSAGEEATPEDDRRIRRLEEMATAPDGSARVLVTHSGNIGGAFGESIQEGDVLVVRDGEVLGIVAPDDWKRLSDATE
jgi:phosphohistidine phosphatase SixA